MNVAAAFIGRPTMPTLPPAQVSFVGLFTYAWLSGRAFRRPRLVICHLLCLWEPRCTVGDQSPPSVSTSPRTFSLLCRGSVPLPACSFLHILSFFKQMPPSTLYIMHVIKPHLILAVSSSAPPSAPVSLSWEYESADGGVSLRWRPPVDMGGRGEVWYGVVCRICPSATITNPTLCSWCGEGVTFSPSQTNLKQTRVTLNNLLTRVTYLIQVL